MSSCSRVSVAWARLAFSTLSPWFPANAGPAAYATSNTATVNRTNDNFFFMQVPRRKDFVGFMLTSFCLLRVRFFILINSSAPIKGWYLALFTQEPKKMPTGEGKGHLGTKWGQPGQLESGTTTGSSLNRLLSQPNLRTFALGGFWGLLPMARSRWQVN